MPDERRMNMGRRATDKMLGEWFWTDRWMGSSAFLLPLEPRGLYREMLTQAWRRGAQLPDDYEAIRRAVGCTLAEWNRCWPKIERYWRIESGELIPVESNLGFSQPLPNQPRGRRKDIPVPIRRAVLERDGFTCCFCRSEVRLELDHVVPYSHGGEDTVENLRVLCKTCNVRRGARFDAHELVA